MNEFGLFSHQALLVRYLRAFRERSKEGAVFWILPEGSRSDQLARLGQLIPELSKRRVHPKIIYGAPEGPFFFQTETNASLWLRRSAACAIAVALPLFLVFLSRRLGNDSSDPLPYFLVTVTGGCLLWLLLAVDSFRLQMKPLGFIQLAFVLPFLLYEVYRWIVKKQASLSLIIAYALVGIFILRLGERLPVSGIERGIRDWLDVTFGLRPRFKEVLGWLLWFFPIGTSAPLSFLGPVSTLNSFLHAHTPVSLIVLRSIVGFLLARIIFASFKNVAQFHRLATEDFTLCRKKAGKVVVAGYFACGNFGDDWLCEAVLFNLSHRLQIPKERILLWPRAWPRLKSLTEIDTVIFAGGLLQDQTSVRSFLYYFAVAFFAAAFVKDRVIFWGSIGPLRTRLARGLLRALCRFLGHKIKFQLRDTSSKEILKKLAPKVEVELFPDPTFFYPLAIEPAERSRTSASPIRLGVFLNGGIRDRNFLEELKRYLVHAALPSSAEISLILSDPSRDRWQALALMASPSSMDMGGTVPPIKKYRNGTGDALKVLHWKEYKGDVKNFFSFLETQDALVSFRLHGAIAGLKLGIPVASLKFHEIEKLRSLVLPEGMSPIVWLTSPTDLDRWLFRNESQAVV